MAFYTGRSGKLFLTGVLTSAPTPAANQSVLKIRDWSIDTSLELLETTTIDTAVKSYTPGMVSSTGSATVMYYRTEAGDVGVQFDTLLNKVMKSTTAGVSESDRVGMILRAGAQLVLALTSKMTSPLMPTSPTQVSRWAPANSPAWHCSLR
jgi:hypothetical protein